MTGEEVTLVLGPLVEERHQHVVIAGQVVDVEGDLRKPDLHPGGDECDRPDLEEQDIRRPAGTDQGRRRSARLLHDLRPDTGPMDRLAVEYSCEEKLTGVIDV
jgi:hypothetical protein